MNSNRSTSSGVCELIASEAASPNHRDNAPDWAYCEFAPSLQGVIEASDLKGQ
jgi:hypothetical protein